MNILESHFRKTEFLVRAIDKKVIADWLLKEGYYPEQYVLPPSYSSIDFSLNTKPYHKNLKKLNRRNLVTVSFPKSALTSRIFGLQHPHLYHDIVYHMMQDWDLILGELFHKDQKIYSYSFPVPVTSRIQGALGTLRSGRMIYEWIEMAERDMVIEAHRFKYLIRTDITNFYNSVYTHSIAWALHGREEALKDSGECKLIGSKIDRLVQYANDARTNGIPVGSALSDLIAEVVLSAIDRIVSERLLNVDFAGSRFKDDYRILCNSEKDAKEILSILSEELISFNLLMNEQKTKIQTLPIGLYREHNREYHPFSLSRFDKIAFKDFEFTLLKVLDIHRKYSGTSIIEKFLSELFDKSSNLKLEFSNEPAEKNKQLLKTISLLMLMKRESEKTLCHVLAICEELWLNHGSVSLKGELKSVVELEIAKASEEKSVFQLIWLIFFSKYLGLGVTNFTKLINKELLRSEILKSIIESKQKFFEDSSFTLFTKPKDCRKKKLAKVIAVFNRKA